MKNIPLIGYTDKLSLRQGETISFKISSLLSKPFSASLKRSISADPNPKGIGIVEKDASKYFKTKSFKSRKQTFKPGSYAISKSPIKISIKKNLNLSAIIFPTLFSENKQTILAFDNVEIFINPKGAISIRNGDKQISIKKPLSLRNWYRINAKIFLIASGLSYTIGVFFYYFDRIKFFHSIWHIFVLNGSLFHYIFVLEYII